MSSCSAVYMANPGIDPIVFTKPVYHDSTSVSSFVGGKFNFSEYLNQYENLTNNNFGQAYLFQTITNKYYNTSYGVFGYLGKMGIKNLENNFLPHYYNYYGAGVSADAQLTLPYGNIVFKPVGFKGSLIYEDGQYYQYRVNEMGGIGFSPDKYMCNLSQTAGINYEFNKSSLGLDVSVGYSYMMPHFIMDMTFSVVVNYSTPQFMIYLQKSSAVLMSNNDFVIGLNYRLH